MNALLRAKREWELVNAQRIEQLLEILKASLGLSLYLLWRSLSFVGCALLCKENLVREDYARLQNYIKYR